ncbi:hypothetical protein ABZ826_35365 [Streptomyces sp. NPDC047515]|uniref:hypothetical protein n=1 Tax=Streptomyces sp. NPDC047515 TaxID=3155380 RepID=UPI0033D806AF
MHRLVMDAPGKRFTGLLRPDDLDVCGVFGVVVAPDLGEFVGTVAQSAEFFGADLREGVERGARRAGDEPLAVRFHQAQARQFAGCRADGVRGHAQDARQRGRRCRAALDEREVGVLSDHSESDGPKWVHIQIITHVYDASHGDNAHVMTTVG